MIKKIIFPLFLLGILCGCRKLVTSEFPDYAAQPNLNSINRAGEPIRVNVSLAQKMDQFKMPFVENAVVNIFEDDVFLTKLEYEKGGYYSAPECMQPLKKYRCELSIPGYPITKSELILPEKTKIINIQHIETAGQDYEGRAYSGLKITFKNNPSERQYYEISVYSISSKWTETGSIPALVKDELHTYNDAVFLKEGLPIPYFSNEGILGEEGTFTVHYSVDLHHANGIPVYQYKDKIVELRTITYDYYKYAKTLYLYDLGRYPEMFSGATTAFNLYSNVSGGKGLFAAYSYVLSDTLYLKKQNGYN